MRLAGIIAAFVLVGGFATLSLLGGTPGSRADDAISLAAADICSVEVATVPVVKTETRRFVTMPAYNELVVTPARYGTRTETVILTPEHREGATFFMEPKRVIVSEPTRRLRVVEPVFELTPDIDGRSVIRPRVENGVLVETGEDLPPLPESRILVSEARIEAVRINAGLKMLDTRILDADGEGAVVPAETTEIEVRTVEAHPAVETVAVAAMTESAEVVTVATPSRRMKADAVCDVAGRPVLLRRVQEALTDKGLDAGTPGEWTPGTVDAVAAAQAEATGYVSPHLLLETLAEWVPGIDMPVS